MLLFVGPRLDRPSAVGDEGRPRALSLGVASLTVLLLALAGGFDMGRPRMVMALGAAGGSVAGGLALLDRDRFGPQCVGLLLSLPVGVGLWAVAVLGGEPRWLRFGFTLAVFGLALSWTGVDSRDGLERAVEHVGIGYFGLLIGSTIGVVAAFGYPQLVMSLLDRPDPNTAVIAFLFTLVALATVGYVALRTLPIVQLSPRPRRDAVRERVRRGRRLAAGLGIASLCSVIFVPAVVSALGLDSGLARVVGYTSSPLVVGPVVLVTTVLALLVTGSAVARRVAAGGSGLRGTAAVLVGTVVGTLLLAAPGAFGIPRIGVVVFLAIGPVALLIGLVGLLLVSSAGVIPRDGSGIVLAAVGLAGATVSAGTNGLSPAYVFVCAAGTAIVWDVSRFGLGLTRELGHVPDTGRLELVHAVAVVGLGLFATAVASLLYTLRTTAAAGVGAEPAMALAALGALLVIVPLRG